jgi:hypothetical protein
VQFVTLLRRFSKQRNAPYIPSDTYRLLLQKFLSVLVTSAAIAELGSLTVSFRCGKEERDSLIPLAFIALCNFHFASYLP